MARLIIKILTLLIPMQSMAQLHPLCDQYYNNTLALNPAFAGSMETLSGTVFYRNQWPGFDGTPKNQSISLHSPVFREKVGLGVVVEANTIGIYKTTSLMGNYSWRMNLAGGSFSMGLGFGFTGFNVAWNELKFSHSDDALLTGIPESLLLPNFSPGIYYYNDLFYAGMSVPMMLSYETDRVTGRYRARNLPGKYNYFFTGGYLVSLGRGIDLLPSVLLKYSYGHIFQPDFTTQAILHDRLWLGLGYRNKNNLIGNFQCQLNYQLRLGYSYSYDLGPVGRYTDGSHEVIINYVFRYRQDLEGPRNFGLN
jgi:type IX secretion system PorP/SprF family membrane protein